VFNLGGLPAILSWERLAMDKNSNLLNNLQLTIVKFFITFGPGNLEKSRAAKKTAENSNAKKKTS
jgi:hypothetical protein